MPWFSKYLENKVNALGYQKDLQRIDIYLQYTEINQIAVMFYNVLSLKNHFNLDLLMWW